MKSFFTAEFFAGNRARLRELFAGTAPIVLTANATLQRNGEAPYKFRQDSSFWYFTGIDEPEVILVIDRDKEYLILPERDAVTEIFDGSLNPAILSQRSGIAEVYDAKSGWKKLESRLRRVKHLATLNKPPVYVKTFAFYTNPARRQLLRRILHSKPELELLDITSHVSRLRSLKQLPELGAMQQAIDITAKAIKNVARHDYDYEYQIEAKITETFLKRGASGHGFNPIISSGSRSTVLHYDKNNGPIEAADLIQLDIGAEVEQYSADISRSYRRGGMSKRQRDVFQAVCAVQDYAFSLIKPGALLRDNELAVEQFMGEKLRELGLIKTISRENVRQFFPHATSHFLGLDAHDAGDYQQPLQASMVITVEPGIYIPGEGLGVRLEDDVLVTKTGWKNLSRRLPRELC